MQKQTFFTQRHDLLCQAINQKRVVMFLYEKLARKVGLHIYRVGQSSKRYLRGYQFKGQSKSRGIPNWRLFEVAKIKGIEMTPQRFLSRPDFNFEDPAISMR